ncbi:carbohydrate ABC transporter permease [Bacillota bacterium Meth-B3]|nr:carbohydrate ABC transporter permease [Christensenellaceae bacterium]MEA5068142.1 carbohydrate ABC transporter permease [Christensenellaceae bacterium]
MAKNPMMLDAVGSRDGRSRRAGKIAVEAVGIILFLLFLMPFWMVVLNSAKDAREIILSATAWPANWGQMLTNIVKIFNNPTTDYVGAFIDSVIITTVSLAVILLCSSMCAWVLVRNKTRWSTIIFMAFVAAMVIPFQVVMFPLVRWLRILGTGTGIPLLGTYQGIVFAYLGFGCSLSVFVLHGFIKGVPMELEEAATIDGCSQSATFFRIVLPLLQPVAVTVLILNGIWIWNDYLLPLLVLGSNSQVQTIPLAVTAFVGSYLKQWDLILTSAMLAMVPIIVLFLFAQKYIIKGMVEGSIK